MKQTLFVIPQAWFDGPLLMGWLIIGLCLFAWLVYKHGWSSEAMNFLPTFGIVALALYFVAPGIGITDINPADPNGPEIKAGLAVRGYGLMMVLGIFAGVGMSMYRGKREGINADKIATLAFCMCICGVIGARLFYVIQKRDQFTGSFFENLGDMVNMTQGGLVVYGSLIGAILGTALYARFAKVPVLKIADIAAPGMLIGLAIGRIGCLLNGCCFGGVCDIPQISQSFPAGAPPYVRQLDTGELLGINSTENPEVENAPPRPGPDFRFVQSVEKGSLAEEIGVRKNTWFTMGYPSTRPLDKELRALKSGGLPIESMVAIQQDDEWTRIDMNDLPSHSLGVYPTQVIAAINAALLAAFLWFYFPFRRRHGQIFALLIILYSVTRFLLELIRRDELGQFGTGLTISQWVSVLVILAGFGLFAFGPERQTRTQTATA